MDKKLNLKALKKAFGVSDKTVRNWIDAGMPCEKSAKGYQFDLSVCIKWRENYLQESRKGSDAYESAKTEREIYRAKITKLNYERLDGTLVPSEDVREAAFEKARLLRDQLLNIPNRIAPILAAEQDSKKSHEILTNEIRQCLETIAGDLKESEVSNEGKN